jgi:hypothetical protein
MTYSLGRRQSGKNLYLMTAVLVLGLAVIFILVFQHKDKYTIPANIRSQLDFPVLFLKNPTPKYALDISTIKYAAQPDSSKVFSFILLDQSNKVTISEQAYPEVLIYDKFTNSLNPYSEVGTLYGKVTLGRPKYAAGNQVAGFKYTDSTLIFARPQKPLSDDQWRTLINSLDIEK